MVASCQGVVDSEDLTLSRSHESPQQNKILCGIKKHRVENCFEMFAGIAEKDDYNEFYEQIGEFVKLASKSGDEHLILKEYVDRMKEGQDDTCYINGESILEGIAEQIVDVLVPQIIVSTLKADVKLDETGTDWRKEKLNDLARVAR